MQFDDCSCISIAIKLNALICLTYYQTLKTYLVPSTRISNTIVSMGLSYDVSMMSIFIIANKIANISWRSTSHYIKGHIHGINMSETHRQKLLHIHNHWIHFLDYLIHILNNLLCSATVIAHLKYLQDKNEIAQK